MRSLGLALRISLFAAFLLAVALGAVLHLFGEVAGGDLLRSWARFQVHEGVAIAEALELRWPDEEPSGEQLSAALAELGEQHASQLAWRDEAGKPLGDPEPHRATRRHRPIRELEIRGRSCRVIGPPFPEAEIPLKRGGDPWGTLVVRSPLHSPETHDAFRRGLIRIGLLVLLAAVGLAIYLTAPIRRMSRSMDRIADGELEYRVPVRGPGEVARMGESFNAMVDRIGELVVGQKELLAGASHELRSPLARMKVTLELLRDGGVATERLDEIEGDVEAIDALVGELLMASRLDLGSLPLKREPVEIEKLAGEAWQRVSGEGATLRVQVEPGAERLSVDRDLVRRLLGNLFENAVRYAGEGEVVLTARPAGDRVALSVVDHGPGVAEQHLPHLFEPFYRADPSRSRSTGGFGLGLMIVRRVITAHGGEVAARRRTDGGLEVVFDLPLSSEPPSPAPPR